MEVSLVHKIIHFQTPNQFQDCTDLKDQWVHWNESTPSPFGSEDLTNFSSTQKMQFLNELLDEPEPLSITKLEKMQELYDLNAYTNSEIRFRWIRLGLQGKWTDAIPRAVKMAKFWGKLHKKFQTFFLTYACRPSPTLATWI